MLEKPWPDYAILEPSLVMGLIIKRHVTKLPMKEWVADMFHVGGCFCSGDCRREDDQCSLSVGSDGKRDC